MSDSVSGYTLVHPVYLDVPMMISFLAHLEGGVSTGKEETTRTSGARERALKARAGLRLRLPAAVDVDTGGEGSTQRRDETVHESKSERHHTEASLFNLLYAYLLEDEQITQVEQASDLAGLKSGQLIELTGEYAGNPLEDLLAFFGALLPYLEKHEEIQGEAIKRVSEGMVPKRGNRRSGNPATRASAQNPPEPDAEAMVKAIAEAIENSGQAFGKLMIQRMIEDLSAAPVHDVLLNASDGLNVVLTASSPYYSTTVNEYLRAGEFRVIGKITRKIESGNGINLARRTVLGAMGEEQLREIIAGMKSADGFSLQVSDPIVEPPVVQVLPMAIFV